MAAHKDFIVTYMFPEGKSVQIPVKAPKYPTDKMIARAVAKMQLQLPEGTGDGYIMRKMSVELGSGLSPATDVMFYRPDQPQCNGTRDVLLYSYRIDLKKDSNT